MVISYEQFNIQRQIEDEIFFVLQSYPLTKQEISNKLNISLATVNNTLQKLVSKKKLQTREINKITYYGLTLYSQYKLQPQPPERKIEKHLTFKDIWHMDIITFIRLCIRGIINTFRKVNECQD